MFKKLAIATCLFSFTSMSIANETTPVTAPAPSDYAVRILHGQIIKNISSTWIRNGYAYELYIAENKPNTEYNNFCSTYKAAYATDPDVNRLLFLSYTVYNTLSLGVVRDSDNVCKIVHVAYE